MREEAASEREIAAKADAQRVVAEGLVAAAREEAQRAVTSAS